ncbi:trifunctional transcriptional activator/DNA repair protein Ada/methylated-DNA--[protein]-cysteine S-methyltransferase [Brochothrix thermosphacta]|uniref:bifunctional transcriptional activator/DNA repair enzyme AdaA n=1 Tax=Brochothrix thermosphacta TaxID=2756 RepID=UPI0027130E87|nr:trifunctional transcriptional activator/DNA repair protein Ada/methylated-DNA--[protein]-cysteine S-methyltransferase [Brochothrix thermosphacta]MDO7863954.1 trifunctional transcriptional activator/DNA repair protein Ada/methylated-DNA--[protein]-cysteine S-methyltransferase [Brochothrix thermosphacta]
MIQDEQTKKVYYKMLIEKNSHYEGVFYVGVKTTGVFCRPTCPARKPKEENCEFFDTAQEATLASYRPCKRCQPLNTPSGLSPEVKELVASIEANPEKKWTDRDFDELTISPNTARRQFKKQFGMTFIEYARARRLGLAFHSIRKGTRLMDAQLDSSFESSNGFRDAFTRTMGIVPQKNKDIRLLSACWIETKLGPMLAIANDEALYLLEFVDRRGLEKEIEKLRKRQTVAIVPGTNLLLERLEQELNQYFNGELSAFETPIATEIGTPFERTVWALLRTIPSGTTTSYKALAQQLGNDKAARAVARANGANQISLLIPCHRVIQSNGEMGGYGGGVERKKWLLRNEENTRKA